MSEQKKEFKLGDCTPIQKAIGEFEQAKNKATKVIDVIYLDGVLSILESILPYENKYLENIKQQIDEFNKPNDND